MAKVLPEAVKKMSGGRFIIDTFAAGAIAPALEVVDAVRRGVCQMAHTWPGYDIGIHPASCLLGGYAGSPNSEVMIHWMYQSDGYKLWQEFRKEKFNVIDTYEASWERLVEVMKPVAKAAGERGVTFCFEPLGPPENEFITCASDGRKLVADVDHPNFQLILDVKAMYSGEVGNMASAVRASRDCLRHFHANDPNLLGPGMGEFDHTDVANALRAIEYDGWVSVEVFRFEQPGAEIARESFAGLQRWYA
jgi:sugar phosphate isomerase/epimerase